jgi:hypothetical protein
VTLSGNGIAATALTISTNPTLPQATQGYAYEAALATSGGVGPYTWSLASGSTLPSGLTLSSTGELSGTVASSVGIGNYSFTVQVTDNSDGATATSLMTLGVYAYLGDGNGESCNDLSWNDPTLNTPLLAITDLGTGEFEGQYEGGLYPNGSNVRPAAQDSYGVGLADAIQPLSSTGAPDPTGKYVLMAIGESTAQNEFNRFLPIANADPAKNPNLVIVNGAQGGATPNTLTSTTSTYWTTVLENYLPQNGVTANQVVAIWMEDTDGIATGTFPSDITTLQSEYETVMQTMLTLFPNLKMVYFSSRVYAGYSNGTATPDNPEPYAYEVGYAVKWAIADQLNGNSNLNYNPASGPVVAPWMSWGPYYWSNGMLGRSDGLVWDCEDFSPDGTHPSIFFGQLKVATKLLQFLKTDDTAKPWYLAPMLGLTATAGNNQTGNTGATLPTALTVLASNLNSGVGNSGVSVTFSDGGAGGTFGSPTAITGSNGTASTPYTLPPNAGTVTITATSTGYTSTTFTEIATSGSVQSLAATAGNNQSGGTGTTLPTALTVTATSNGVPVAGVSVTFSDNSAGGSFGTPTVVTGTNGTASTTYTLPFTQKSLTITATSSGYNSATFTETADTLALSPNGGNNQTGGIGTALPVALTVLASNDGSPVSGLGVNFTDNGAGGTFGAPTATTGTNGIASTTYKLPANAQTVTITASSAGYTSATFTETAAVCAISATNGNNQSGMESTTLSTALSVSATCNGTPESGVSITFNDGGAGGSFGTPTVTTGSGGTASTTYTLPASVEVITITAANSDYTSATFTETSTPTVTSITIVSGQKQSGTAGTTLPLPIVLKAKNASGKAVSGAPITFTDAGLGGTFSPNPAITSSNGEATTTFTLPTAAKTFAANGADGSVSVNVTETSVAGPASSLSIVSGNNQQAEPGKALTKKLVVSVTDQYKNPISGVTVTFTDNGAGGTFSTKTPVTAANGQASVTYTCGTKAGSVTISATTTTLGPVNFTETVK